MPFPDRVTGTDFFGVVSAGALTSPAIVPAAAGTASTARRGASIGWP
jgi:hypothetical protein